jgi:Ca2+-binding EF-hand superfamily protein
MAKKAGSSKAGPKPPATPAASKPDGIILTAEEVAEIKESFDLFDTDKSGSIDPSEINAAIASLGSDHSSSIFRLLEDISSLGGSINFEQFLAHVVERLGNRTTRAGINRIFALFDDENKGTISIQNLKRVARELGESLTEEELRQELARVSGNKTEITPEDFYQIMIKKAYS